MKHKEKKKVFSLICQVGMSLPRGGFTYGSQLITDVHPLFVIASGDTEEKVLHVKPLTERVLRL